MLILPRGKDDLRVVAAARRRQVSAAADQSDHTFLTYKQDSLTRNGYRSPEREGGRAVQQASEINENGLGEVCRSDTERHSHMVRHRFLHIKVFV